VGALLSLAASSIAVEPGGRASLSFRVRNTGSVVDEFTFDVLGESGAWAVVEPGSLSLFPGAEGEGTVVFRPPRSSASKAGAIPFGLRARSREDPSGSAVEEGTVEVAGFVDLAMELVPHTSRGRTGGAHELAIDNRGNQPLEAQLQGTDPEQALRFDFRPQAVTVPPGAAQFARLQVRAARRFWRGQARTHPFQVTLQPEGGVAVLRDGTFLQEPILPGWTGRALATLLAVLVAALVLWFLAVRPSIQSAAAEAVASPMAQLRSDVNSALGAAGLPTLGAAGGGSGSGQASPSPSPSPSAGASPSASPSPAAPTPPLVIPGLGIPVDGRLDATAATVVPTRTLFITDLVFANPNGRSGALVLLRGSSHLFELRLENFRDLDFHFVTPLVVRPGEPLSLSLACSGAGPCDPSLLYSGFLRP
jgi:hypothetical protein